MFNFTASQTLAWLSFSWYSSYVFVYESLTKGNSHIVCACSSLLCGLFSAVQMKSGGTGSHILL